MALPSVSLAGVFCRTSWKCILHSSITSPAVFGVSFLMLSGLMGGVSDACLITCGNVLGMMFNLWRSCQDTSVSSVRSLQTVRVMFVHWPLIVRTLHVSSPGVSMVEPLAAYIGAMSFSW